MGLAQRKWTKEGIESYFTLHPNATLKEMAKDMGVSKQRMYQVLKLLDIELPGRTEKVPAKKGTGHTQAAHIRQNLAEPGGDKASANYPQSRARLLLVSPCSNSQLVEAIKGGVTAYLARETSEEEMGQLAHIAGSAPVGLLNGRLHRLTKREIEILRHVAGGNTHSQIGKALGITEQTVKNHVSHIILKLSANNKAHAVVIALQSGILSLNEIAPDQSTKEPDATNE